MYHVKEMVGTAPGNLDMNVADEDEFSPDKLRSTVERLYMTVVCTRHARHAQKHTDHHGRSLVCSPLSST